ncbi:MAG TPA: aminoacyl-tRNA hydrolase [Thermotogota bacterium]|nr:aminoacyl-tRNA hydrolase [Thermotogota bacterium]HRW91866.1 aminoacyl-tRNA hydrolase [Thermotogota bacterium]
MHTTAFIGLGNPGPRYERNWHNAGFLAIDRFVQNTWKDRAWLFQKKRTFEAWYTTNGDTKLILVKPQTYMNLSGVAFQQVKGSFAVSPEEMIVVFDDFSLPLGKIRLRFEGSAGGQKGMLSIIHQEQSSQIKRIRIGIGPKPEGIPPPQYVLSDIPPQKRDIFQKVLEEVNRCMLFLVENPFEEAMNRFNSLDLGVEDAL